MNVGSANAIWPVRGSIELHVRKKRIPSASDLDAFSTAGTEVSGVGDVNSGEEMDPGEVLQLLREGRLDGEGMHRRIQEAIENMQAAPGHDREDVGALLGELHDSLREILNSGLFDEETRALLEKAFSQFETDTKDLQEVLEGPVDAQQVYEEIQEAFERFLTLLKPIFGLVEETGAGNEESEAKGEMASDSFDEIEELSAGALADDIHTADDEAEDEDASGLGEKKELLDQIIETYQETLGGGLAEAGSDGDLLSLHVSEGEEETENAYARFIATYEKLHDASSLDRSSFHTEG